MLSNNKIFRDITPASIIIPSILIAVMVITSFYTHFLLFHTISEFFSIFVALAIGMIAYYTFPFTKNRYLLFLGLGYIWVALLDIVHVFTFPGMNFMSVDGSNTTLGLWVLTRILESFILLVAIFMRKREFNNIKVIFLFAFISLIILLITLFAPMKMFETEGGLTVLKNSFEYMIIVVLLITMYLNRRHREEFHKNVYLSIQAAIVFTIIAEIFFTVYTDMYGLMILLGHIFKFLSFWVIYKSIVTYSLQQPVKKLRESEEQLSYQNTILNSVLNTTPDLIFYKDYLHHDGKYIGCNSAFEAFAGRSNKEIVNYTDIELFGKKVGSFFRANDKRMLKVKETVINEEWVDYPDGHRVLLSTSKTPLYDENRNILGVLGVSRDITNMYESTKEMQKLKERMELALVGNKDGLWDWNLLDNTAYFSPRWKEMLGYSDSELPNEFSTWKNYIHPDDFKDAFLALEENIKGKTEYYEGNLRMKHKDGHWVWILCRGKTIYDERAKAIRMTGTHTDISAEKIMQLKYALQAQIIEQIHDSVISTDLDGNIVSWNVGSEKLLGYKSSEIIGKHMSIFHRKKDIETFKEYESELLKRGSYNADVYFVKKSKDLVYVSVSLSLLKDESGNIVGLIGVNQDITKRKKAEEQLLQQSRLAQMGEMISMIAHQWRQPLGAISSTAINLQMKIMLETFDLTKQESIDEWNKYFLDSLKNIDGFVQSLTTTIDDFRNFYKPNKKSVMIKLEDVVNKSLNIIKASLINDNIEINREYNSNQKIELYDSEMMQVILNILKNAQDNFHEKEIENKKITIKIEEKSILICDNGGGVPQDIAEKIFDPYFSTKDEKNGTGLGLYMSKIIIEDHHAGKLSVQNIGNGACFKIELA